MKTKDLIFDKALKLFSLHGYDGTSIRMICKEVGISESSLYNHFAGKKQLLAAILATCDDLLLQENPTIAERRALAENLNLRDILHFLVTKYISTWKEPKNLELWQVVSNEQYKNRDAGMIIIQETERRIERLAATFNHLQKHHKMISCNSEQLATSYIYSIRAQHLDYVLSQLCLPDSEQYINSMFQTGDMLADLYEIK